MEEIQIKKIAVKDKPWIQKILEKHWGSTKIVSRGRLYKADKLPGFIAVIDGQSVGLLIYRIENGECKIIALASEIEGKGVGSALIEKAKKEALDKKCKRLWVITTNDNLKAQHFYEKRGFVLKAIYKNALEVSRKLKPEIPLIDLNGIPLKDDVELEMKLN